MPALNNVLNLISVNPRRSTASLSAGSCYYRCAIGRHGLTNNKREGDGKTPIGQWVLRQVFYRADRIRRPQTLLPITPIDASMGWCDDPNHKQYNCLVNLPFSASVEQLWRNDHIYDLIVVLGHNDNPVVKGRGSAIFMHVARNHYAPTLGCIALSENNLRTMISFCGRKTSIWVK